MSAYIILGLIFVAVAVLIGILLAFEKGPHHPKDYYRGWKK